MITIRFNEREMSIQPAKNLSELLQDQAYVSPYFAVAINRCFIPRDRYQETRLNEGDVIEIVTPMQGG